jgi:hypothetical protein
MDTQEPTATHALSGKYHWVEAIGPVRLEPLPDGRFILRMNETDGPEPTNDTLKVLADLLRPYWVKDIQRMAEPQISTAALLEALVSQLGRRTASQQYVEPLSVEPASDLPLCPSSDE